MKKVLIVVLTFIAGSAFAQGKWWPREVNIHVPAISSSSSDIVDLSFNVPPETFEGNYRISSTQFSDSVSIVLHPITFNFVFDTSNQILNNFKFELAVHIFAQGDTVIDDTVNNTFVFHRLRYVRVGDYLYVDDSGSLCMNELDTAHGYEFNFLNGQRSELWSFKSQEDTANFRCKLTFALEKPINSIPSLIDNDSSSLKIYPNPSTGSTRAFCMLKTTSVFHLHIFTELGKDIMTVYDGILETGQHDFSFKLPQGMYYVRMETAEGVVTKRVVVE
jgi:hypothetical protein